ncbi:MAG TPA: phosphatase PAP2 family protein [Terriglobales bacterium]|nr:phosphatase PAP2 family protein [Terriglobales bacterium]
MADMVQGEVTLAAGARAASHPAALPLGVPRLAVLPLNLVDWLYAGYFLGLGVLIFVLRQRVPAWGALLALHAACVAGLLLLGVAGARRDRVWNFLHDWYPLVAFIVCFEEVARLSFLLVDGWQDGWLLALEARLFPLPPTVWLQQFASPLFTELMELGYFSYFALLMIVGGVLYGRADRRPFRDVMTASVLSYFFCYAVFLLFPTEGPAHTLAAQHTVALHGGPFHWAVLLIQRLGGVHGNAFPSSHVAAGVVALVFAWRYAPRLGAALTPLVLLLCAGAVYDRYHYFSDVVAGIAVGAAAAAVVLVPLGRIVPARLLPLGQPPA